MTDTLQWAVRGETFDDGSRLADWNRLETSGEWHWQYDTHELTFDIYEHDGQFWKLYRIRFVPEGADDYVEAFGGQACRMALVAYTRRARSPHSARLFDAGEREWVRTYEVDTTIHELVRTGRPDARYGAPYGPKRSAA
ncbi:MAG: hypothetical protein ACR2PO_16595 [Methyloligellaceae bacterium]